jgi:glutaredoxin
MKVAKYTIYSTPTCHYCHLLKDWLKENGVEFEDKDVSVDAAARQEMVEKSHQLGVPVSIVQMEENGDNAREEIIIGFDQMRLGEMLGIG